MKIPKYELEIHGPKDADTPFVRFESENPFMNISVGDILNPRVWPNADYFQNKVLRVINIEHIICETIDKMRDKICIFTESAEDTSELRIIKT